MDQSRSRAPSFADDLLSSHKVLVNRALKAPAASAPKRSLWDRVEVGTIQSKK